MKFRLILDPPRPAALNMSIDEMLMETQALPEAVPTLRFYSWAGPACSIGYFQNAAQIAERFQLTKKDIPVVRRITGGGLVFHGEDITFSITVKANNIFFSGSAKDAYLKVNEAVRAGLRPIFPEIDYADCKNIPSGRGKGDRICFEAPSCYDLLLHGKKIAGASQRRKNSVILYQSSIFLNGNEKTLRERLVDGFKENWKIDCFEKPLSETELLAARREEACVLRRRIAHSDEKDTRF